MSLFPSYLKSVDQRFAIGRKDYNLQWTVPLRMSRTNWMHQLKIVKASVERDVSGTTNRIAHRFRFRAFGGAEKSHNAIAPYLNRGARDVSLASWKSPGENSAM